MSRRRALTQELPVPHAPLLTQSRTLLLLNEAVELALDALEAAPLAIMELAIEGGADLLPLLRQVDAVVPDEVHFLLLVLWPRRPAAVAVGRGGAGDAGVALAGVVGVWRGGLGERALICARAGAVGVRAGAGAGGRGPVGEEHLVGPGGDYGRGAG